MATATVVHQAKVTYSDGTTGRFFSADGIWFYEHQLPDPHAQTKPMQYEREWLKAMARRSSQIAGIEFTETAA